MATRSIIAMKNPDQSVTGIYCHWDGYPEGVGATLEEYYRNEEKIKALLKLGSLSSLEREIEPAPGVEHRYGNAADGVCVAYHRDRGEELQEAKTWRNQDVMLRETPETHWAEYCYLWDGGKWYVGVCDKRKWYLLSDVLNSENNV